MDEKRLKSLKNLKIPKVEESAREQALQMAMQELDREFDREFDSEFARESVGKNNKNIKTSKATKGIGGQGRPISIINWIKGFVPMNVSANARFPIAATITGLLVLPLGLVLYQNTALTPLNPTEAASSALDTSTQLKQDLPVESEISPAPLTDGEVGNSSQALSQARREVVSEVAAEVFARVQSSESLVDDRAAISPDNLAPNMAPNAASNTVAPNVEAPNVEEMETGALGRLIQPAPYPQSAVAQDALMQQGFGEAGLANNDKFAQFDESAIKLVSDEPVSTFSIDVDTVSYAYIRRALREGRLPDPASVRIEEMINYFSYAYEAPKSVENAFAPQMEIVPSPWNNANQLLRIGIEGYVPPANERAPVNLVFLIDSSGSMDASDKLPLLKRALALALDQLNENDQVSIVTYAGAAGMVLAPTSASDKVTILAALNNLYPGGSTAGAAGIELAYDLAEQASVEGSINRVLLATDGDFNVGISTEEELKRFIEIKRQSGTFLSVLGFGTGNLNDALMQTLAQNGNGSAYYIDSFSEARKVLGEEIGATLTTIAKDVKIQVEFNPAFVSQYRLIGYETRALAREDFNNDKVDAGEIGAGSSVTALYELTPVGAQNPLIDPLRYGETVAMDGGQVDVAPVSANEIGFFRLRYKAPDGDVSKLLETAITPDMVKEQMSEASIDTRFAVAVAAFGQKLRRSSYQGNMTYAQIRQLALEARGEDKNGYRAEFLQLVDLAAAISGIN